MEFWLRCGLTVLPLVGFVAPLAGQEAEVPCPKAGSNALGYQRVADRFTFQTPFPSVQNWISDGTADGTYRLEELCPEGCRGFTAPRAVLASGLLFETDDGLWFGDGSREGASRFGAVPRAALQFGAIGVTAGGSRAFLQRGDEFWVSDGTAGGTLRVFTKATDREVGPPLPTYLGGAVVGEKVFLLAAAPAEPSQIRLWRGAGDQTIGQAVELPPGASVSPLFGAFTLAASGQNFFFSLVDEAHGTELGVADATGSARQLDLTPGPASSRIEGAVAGRRLAFLALAEPSGEKALWTTDGTSAGTRRLGSFAATPELMWISPPEDLLPQDLLLFVVPADSGEELGALWASDGTVAGTQPLGPRVRRRQQPLQGLSTGVLFAAYDDEHGEELWQTDGTPAGTRRLADLCPGPCSSRPQVVAVVGNTTFLRVQSDGPGGHQTLWRLDAGKADPERLTPPRVAFGAEDLLAFAGSAVGLGERLFFTAGEAGNREPWVCNTTSNQCEVLVDLQPGNPEPPAGPWLTTSALPGFRVQVAIESPSGLCRLGRVEPACLAETLCASGALAGRPEVFVRVVGPKPNGLLWPTIFRATTADLQVWIEQIATGERRYYELPGAAPGRDELDGLFDRLGFEP